MDETIIQALCKYLEIQPEQVFKNRIPLDLSFVFQLQDRIRNKRELFYDKNVVSIKMTLYRLAKQSKIVEALIEAAENGKEKDRIEYFTQIGTGNYNEKTAKLYTDLSIMTANADIGMEANRVLQNLSMGSFVEETAHLLVAPRCLQNKVIAMIDKEIEQVQNGNLAYVGLKLNSLTDKKIIDKIIETSKAGVKIDMIIRGICFLIPGVEGETENIRIVSIVGRFLEHSRIYIFGTTGREKVYIASADFMTRNTLRRVEVAIPVYDETIKNRLLAMFGFMLRDNQKARWEDARGEYNIDYNDEEPLNVQEFFYEEAYQAVEKKSGK